MNWLEVIGYGAAIFASTGFWTFVQNRAERRDRMKDKKANDSLEHRALKALLHDRIYECCTDALKNREISADDYENLTYMYTPYRELGGNGTCERMMKEVEKLPLIMKGENNGQ